MFIPGKVKKSCFILALTLVNGAVLNLFSSS